ncbi:MAG: DUF1501 domain-containing protein [Pirellulaceae bacterium]|nr:DUF1501 domain-containing protein [Pirellulaceae bacterium]
MPLPPAAANFDPLPATIARRAFLSAGGLGLGSIALSSLLGREARGATSEAGGAIVPLHHPPRVKRVIWLYMSGGPSHLETFDHKPELAKRTGQPMPASFTAGQPIAQLQGKSQLKILGPLFDFQKHGQSGQEISSALPHIAGVADEICIVRSLVTEAINHDPAHTFMNTGTAISGRPSMGSWVTYGLGSEADDLPGFVVLTSFAGRSPQPISTRMWHNGFLPGRLQGIKLNSTGAAVEYLDRPAGVSPQQQRDVLDAVRALNQSASPTLRDPEIETRLAQYEMAFRMQVSVPQLLDFSDESQSTLDLYGAQPGDGSFASNCLLARRMAERGVRFIQLYHRDWDHHNNLKEYVGVCAGACDRASAALIADLKQRGMLDETLVVWGGEFGRTPMAQDGKGSQLGRDHHMKGFSMWLAGGGIRPGMTHGATDELGYHSVEKIVHVHDLHATMLHLLGIDHERFTYRWQGRDFRLTDVKGHVVREILT